MSFSYRRVYRGPIEAVLLDWAGTTMDFGCIAPAVVFVEVFKRQGVPIDVAEARAPMGAHKRTHIQRITELDSVRARWKKSHGRLPGEEDVDRMFKEFVPLQLKCLSKYSDLIPGALQAVDKLRKRRIKIGSTTGYTTEMMKINQKDAARQGYKPDHAVSATEVPAGRPFPHMCLENVIHLGVSTVRGAFSKVAGTATYDPANPSKDSLEAIIDASSVDTRVEMRDNDLKSSHFFDVQKYPTITFKSKAVKNAGAGKLSITGDLTMHGVTKEVVLEVEGPSAPIKDPMGPGQRIGASASTKVNSQDFGIAGAPGVVSDEITITIDVEMIQSLPAK